ncbi:hypothetical protein CEXT_44391 [Caerostris extrusa]|uniref:Uncharacterized protein n=1 Tax=Caerostris extrusa TaxID=172846 RepID=A0AAV4W043_CAEEX|nr:hypothetical protein CEXT_44391 [Caerostris extrusa]
MSHVIAVARFQVHFGVIVPRVAPRELPSARVAREGLLSRVRSEVRGQVVRATEVPHAHTALEGLLSGVRHHMAIELGKAVEPSVAIIHGTGVTSLLDWPLFGLVGGIPGLDRHRTGLRKAVPEASR